jgi:hypothetical protein
VDVIRFFSWRSRKGWTYFVIFKITIIFYARLAKKLQKQLKQIFDFCKNSNVHPLFNMVTI